MPKKLEDHLWTEVTKTIKKLKPTNRHKDDTPSEMKLKPKAERASRSLPNTYGISELKIGETANIDKSTVSKVNSGKYPIDDRLDLHGYNTITAYNAFEAFIHKNYQCNSRLLLVVTGKGSLNPGKVTIRSMLSEWINYDKIRGMILRVSQAAQKHGGNGAYYILLKRHR